MSYKTYTSLKDSNVEWLGLIPEHWDVVSAKYCYSIQLGKMLQPLPVSSTDLHSPYLKALHVLWERILTDDLPTMWATASDIEKYEVLKGDLLVCEGGEVGRAGILGNLKERTIIQNSLHRIRSNKNNLKFLMYILRTIDEGGWFDVLCNKATISHLTGEKLGALHIPIPPKHEQDLIVNYVENRTAHVDELIGLKEKQIELLEIKLQAIISQAVTRGLNPDARMKPSGLDWLGEIPEHWQLIKLKYLAKIKYGLGQPPRLSDDGLPLIRATNISKGKILTKDLLLVDPDDVPYDRDPILHTNDVIVVRSGAYTGDSAIIPPEYDGSISGYDLVVRATKANPEFLAYSLLSTTLLENQIALFRMRAAQPHLNAEDLGSCYVPFPLLEEQFQIVSHLNSELGHLDEIVALITHQINLLLAYRQTLITSAVTGKIDVRGVEI